MRAASLAIGAPLLLASCAAEQDSPSANDSSNVASPENPFAPEPAGGYTFVEGTQVECGFVVDDALETPGGRTLHFSLHVPDAYDGSVPYALYIACPGWEGLYFQGVGANLQEDFPFVANCYVPDMIVVSPQLDDWGEQSAADVIELTEWLLGAYNVDHERVYLSGCSGGGETISIVLGTRPELYRRALHTISRWDGDIDVLADAEVPVYMAIGENDDYYGSEPAREAAERMRAAYRERGLPEERVDELVALDVKPTSYFVERGFPEDADQHGAGGYLFAHDEEIMGWLFS